MHHCTLARQISGVEFSMSARKCPDAALAVHCCIAVFSEISGNHTDNVPPRWAASNAETVLFITTSSHIDIRLL